MSNHWTCTNIQIGSKVNSFNIYSVIVSVVKQWLSCLYAQAEKPYLKSHTFLRLNFENSQWFRSKMYSENRELRYERNFEIDTMIKMDLRCLIPGKITIGRVDVSLLWKIRTKRQKIQASAPASIAKSSRLLQWFYSFFIEFMLNHHLILFLQFFELGKM